MQESPRASGNHNTAHVRYGQGDPGIPSWNALPFFTGSGQPGIDHLALCRSIIYVICLSFRS
jgi:hypothetical protein